MGDKEQFLWVEKYRPKKVADCILSSELKDTFSNYVKDNKIPNMILAGGPGTGKTTSAVLTIPAMLTIPAVLKLCSDVYGTLSNLVTLCKAL